MKLFTLNGFTAADDNHITLDHLSPRVNLPDLFSISE